MADQGTLSVTAGSLVVTGTLTSLIAAAGDLLVIGAAVGVVASRDSTTQLTLKQPWGGATITNAANWYILPTGPSWDSPTAVNLRLLTLIQKWEVGPYKWDQAGSFAGRASYNNQGVGFTYLSIDPLPFTLYVKKANTNSASDWSAGQVIYQKADSTQAAEAARDAAAASATAAQGSSASAAGYAAATAADRVQTGQDRTATAASASAASGYANNAQTSANNASSALAGAVRWDNTQSLTAPQKTTARSNIGAAVAGENSDIYRLIGPGGAGVDIFASETAVTGQGTCDLSTTTTLKVGLTITGPITSFGTTPHIFKLIRFASTGTLVNSSQLVLPTAANIVVAVGDRAWLMSNAGGVGIIVGYHRIDGTPLKSLPIVTADITDASAKLVRADVAQTLPVADQLRARQNIGAQPIENVAQCRLVMTSATQLTLQPFNGNLLFINGTPVTVSSPTLSNSGLSASSVYYIYAYNNGGVVGLEASTTGHATSATYGGEVKNGDPTRVLVGAVYTTSSGTFGDSEGFRCVASYFNRRNKSFTVPKTSGAQTSNTSSYSNLGSYIQIWAWPDEAMQICGAGSASNNTAYNYVAASIMIDGGPQGLSADGHIINAGYATPVSPSWAVFMAEGWHNLSVGGFVGGGTGSFSFGAQGIVRS